LSPRLARTLRLAGVATVAAVAGFAAALLLPRLTGEVKPAKPGAPAAAPAQAEGFPAPDFSLPGLDGTPKSLKDFRGRWLFINFWATWCAPCLHEIPVLVAAQDTYGASGLQVLGVAMDDPEAVKQMAAEKALNYPTLVGDEAVQQLMERYGNTLGALPYSVLVGPDGVIRYVELGGIDRDKIDALAMRFLPR